MHQYSYDRPRQYFQADLAYMTSFNLNFAPHQPEFCLVVVDGVSKKVYLRVTSKKTADKVLSSFKHIFEDIERDDKTFIYLQTDQGGEFFNNKMKEWCCEQNIVHFSSKNYGKAYLAELTIGRLKQLYQKLRKHGELQKNNWSFYIEDMEKKLNEKERVTSGIAPEDLDADDAKG
ncbi:uncharacterized protein LOC136081315 [Hydra vulgaris]|uniref:Uncharacterized protein LOC136081315 n=1 Tax=Hydra vulgaris TaxID=6087 RepID=A0ABM4BZJ7_HYDVU